MKRLSRLRSTRQGGEEKGMVVHTQHPSGAGAQQPGAAGQDPEAGGLCRLWRSLG